MTYAVVYSSKTGNTRMLAETIKKELPEETCVYFGEACEQALQADRIYVGFWTDKGNCDQQTADFLKTVSNQQLFLFGTAGFGGSQQYFDQILERAAQNISNPEQIIGRFMCQGKMPMSVRQRYEKMLESQAKVPNLQGMIDNFDRALSHPDQHDLEQLRTAIQAL